MMWKVIICCCTIKFSLLHDFFSVEMLLAVAVCHANAKSVCIGCLKLKDYLAVYVDTIPV